MSNNIYNNHSHVGALELSVPFLRLNSSQASAVETDMHLNNIQDVAHEALENYRAEIADFRIQTSTGMSVANARVSAKERETFTPILQSLAESLASRGKFARINPNLNIIVMIKDGVRTTIYADTLEGDAKIYFERLKLHYNTKHGGFACTRPTFTNGGKANLNGYQPFYTKVSEDLKARAFIKHDNFAKITEGMTKEKKRIVQERIKLVEILVVNKIKRYESLIETIKTNIGTAQQAGDEDEVEGLQKDLTKLQKKLQELKRLDPVALYWLAAFYPENPDDKEECKLQARVIEIKAKEILKDDSHAYDLASVLIKDREEYFFFSGSKGMQNTQPMEDILREVVGAENEGNINQLVGEYESNDVRDKLDNIHIKLNNRVTSRFTKSAPKKAEFVRRTGLAHVFVHERLDRYRNLEASIYRERQRLEGLPLNAPHMAEFERSAQVIRTRIEELEGLSRIRFNLFAQYYVRGRKKQKNNLNALAATARRLGYGAEEIKQLKRDIMRPEVRNMLRAMMNFEKDCDSDAFAAAALSSLEKGGNLQLAFQNAVQCLEKGICNDANAHLSPINPLVNGNNIINNDDDNDNNDFEPINLN